ncbi:hypothetical protein R0K17_29690, partial [Planococcus sp. SIMBA_143]
MKSMVEDGKDAFNARVRSDGLLRRVDGKREGIQDGEAIVLYNKNGVFQGFARSADIRSGNLGIQFPEGNYLVPKG